MLKEIRQLGFPVVELGHAIRFSLWPGILKAWEEDLIRIQTLHNFCPVPTSIFRPDPNCYEFSDPRPAPGASAAQAAGAGCTLTGPVSLRSYVGSRPVAKLAAKQ